MTNPQRAGIEEVVKNTFEFCGSVQDQVKFYCNENNIPNDQEVQSIIFDVISRLYEPI